MTQKEIIKNYIEQVGWIEEYKVRAIQTDWGWIGARGDRDVRDMIKSGTLEKKMNGKYCMVRVKPMQKPENSMHWRPEVLRTKLISDSQKSLL
ncbi:MAG: hypothetical protein AAB875_01005 [Patescibacteria group bacterium]